MSDFGTTILLQAENEIAGRAMFLRQVRTRESIGILRDGPEDLRLQEDSRTEVAHVGGFPSEGCVAIQWRAMSMRRVIHTLSCRLT